MLGGAGGEPAPTEALYGRDHDRTLNNIGNVLRDLCRILMWEAIDVRARPGLPHLRRQS
jgi:hypothetical protein